MLQISERFGSPSWARSVTRECLMRCVTGKTSTWRLECCYHEVGFDAFAGFLSTVCCLAFAGVCPRLVLLLMSYPFGIMTPIEKTGTKNLSENPSQAGSLRHEIGFPDRF